MSATTATAFPPVVPTAPQPGTTGSAQPAITPQTKGAWNHSLSQIFWINSVAISNDGARVLAATYLHDYTRRSDKFLPNVHSWFGTYCLDGAAGGATVWQREYEGWDGIFGVAVSAGGEVAAAGGFFERVDDTASGLLRAYNGADGRLLLSCNDIPQRVSTVALSRDGRILAAAADDVYVFVRRTDTFGPVPLTAGLTSIAGRYITAVAVHPSGKWLAACDQIGHVYLAVIEESALDVRYVWSSAEGNAAIPFLSVAIAEKRQSFVVGGGNFVYVFDAVALANGQKHPPMEFKFDPADPEVPPPKANGKPQENVRWVATSADGDLITLVANRQTADKSQPRGLLIALTPTEDKLALAWYRQLDRAPNSTSIDAAGQFVSAADGYPPGTPGKFYLFDRAGNALWNRSTHNMHWPMVISGDGKWVVGGSDDGSVYYSSTSPKAD